MKNIKTLFTGALLATILILTGCDDFTETPLPESQLSGPEVFESLPTANAALANTYAKIRDSGIFPGTIQGLSCLLGNYTDELSFYGPPASPVADFYNHSILPANNAVSAMWGASYNQIYTLNALILGVEQSVSITGADRERLLGEAYFLRAFIHFYLTSLFGDIPYITTTDYRDNSTAVKLPRHVVYEHIISDLVQAQQLIPQNYVGNERVRPNFWAVTALLTRVYVYTQQWEKAEASASAVINETTLYVWEPDLEKVFLKDCKGTLWQLHPGTAGNNTSEARTFIFTGSPVISAISNALLAAFEPTDLRLSKWIGSATAGGSTFYYPFKYKKNGNTGSSQEYSVVMRLEEQFLLRAEARVQTGNLEGARTDLDHTRLRAGLLPSDAQTAETLLEEIFAERQREFFTEYGHRWFDLVRTGKATEILQPLKPGWRSAGLLLPLPSTELTLNSGLLPQNLGY